MNTKININKNLKNFIKRYKKSIKTNKNFTFLYKKLKIFKINNIKYIDSNLIKSFNLYFQYLQSFEEFLILDSFKNIRSKNEMEK